MSAYLSVICSCGLKARNGNVMMSSQSFVSLQSHQCLHSLPDTGSPLPTAWGESAFANFLLLLHWGARARAALALPVHFIAMPIVGGTVNSANRDCALAAATASIVYPGIFHIAPLPLCSYALSSTTQIDTFTCLLAAQLPCNYTDTN